MITVFKVYDIVHDRFRMIEVETTADPSKPIIRYSYCPYHPNFFALLHIKKDGTYVVSVA